MKIDDQALMSFGNAAQIDTFVKGKYGATLPPEFLSIFCQHQKAALIFKSQDKKTAEVLRKNDLTVSPDAVIGLPNTILGNNISSMIVWEINGVVYANVAEDS